MPCHVALERAEQGTKQARLKNVLPSCIIQVQSTSTRCNYSCTVQSNPAAGAKSPRTFSSNRSRSGPLCATLSAVLCCAVYVCMYVCMYVQFVAVNRRSRSSACQPFPEDGISFLSFHQFRFRNCRHLSDSFRKPRTSNLALSFFPFLHPTPPPPPPPSLPVTGSPPPRPSSSSSSSV